MYLIGLLFGFRGLKLRSSNTITRVYRVISYS